MKGNAHLIVSNNQDDFEITIEMEDVISNVTNKVLELEGINFPCEISVVITNDEEIEKINYEYRGKDMPTDVLSFPQLEFAEAGVIDKHLLLQEEGYPVVVLGDIVISIERTAQQAALFGHSLIRELGFLTAHSMYHLLGYDHEIEEEEKIMKEKQEAALNNLGIFR